MNEIDEFLAFLLEHEYDKRINIKKMMKYGHRFYQISFSIDEIEDKNYGISDSLEIIIDNRNECIEILYDGGRSNIIIEDKTMMDKWNAILEDYVNKDLSKKAKSVIKKTLSSCYNKNLYREYQMKKILPDETKLIIKPILQKNVKVCPSCKDTDTYLYERFENNGVIGTGCSSWIVDSYWICNECGTQFNPKESC